MKSSGLASTPRKVLLALLFLGLRSPAAAQGNLRDQDPAFDPLPVGINLRPITPYDRAWTFADAMKMASPWHYPSDDPTPPLRKAGRGSGDVLPSDDEVPVDDLGWPRPTRGRAVSSQVFVGMRGRFPAGQYVCTWKGSGTFDFRGSGRVLSREDHRIVVDVDPWRSGPVEITLSDFSAADPTRDIHLWLPGLEESCSYFHPVYLDRLRPFSVLRFYPWMRVYSSSGVWSERETLASARQTTPEGVAIEYMVDLCNELGSDPWFCIPHRADDDYVRRFAELVRDSLHRDARIYLEYSNEVWNTDYLAGEWARDEARRRGVQVAQVTAEGAARVFGIWREVFGRQASRVVRVAGAHLHNPGYAQSLCRYLDGQFDAIAVGAYFAVRPDRDPVDAKTTAEELLRLARANLENLVLPRIADHRDLASTFSAELGRHIALVSYEGGQSIVARSPGGGLDLAATLQCQRMPEMFDAYRALIEGGRARGLELLVAYDFAGLRGSADTFSVLEYMEEPLTGAVKYRALIQGWEERNQ